MKKYQKRENYIKVLIISICLFLTGCGTIGLAQEATFESAYENKPEEEPVNIFTSEGCGIIQKIDEASQEVMMYMIDRKEERTFSYSLATTVQDKYGSELIMKQLMPGEVVDVSYNNELEKLGSIKVSAESWMYDSMEKYRMNIKKGTVDIGSDTYGLSKNVQVFSEGRQLDISQVLRQDVLSFRGKGREIVSIIVEKGHGYLDLSQEEALLGGWIEVGQTVITEIREDMLITVPEGDYTVRITADEIEEIKTVTIERDKETVLNFGHIEVEKPTNGRVVFEILPVTASVFIDDNEVDPTYAIRLPFGIHKVTASADGYDTLSEYFEVTEEDTVVKMSLSEAEEVVTVSDNAIEEKEYKVTVQGPIGVEVYMDNLYKGIAPVSFEKVPGEHVVTLRKTGYITTSHSVYIADDEGDITYNFADLVEAADTESKKDDDTADDNEKESSVSDNSVSDNKADSSDEKDKEKESDEYEIISVSENMLIFSFDN